MNTIPSQKRTHENLQPEGVKASIKNTEIGQAKMQPTICVHVKNTCAACPGQLDAHMILSHDTFEYGYVFWQR